MQQSISCSDEIRCLWDFLRHELMMAAVIQPTWDTLFLKII